MDELPKTRYQDPALAAAYFIAETTGKTKLLPRSVVKDTKQWLYSGSNAQVKKNMKMIFDWIKNNNLKTSKFMYHTMRKGLPKVSNNVITDDAVIYAMYHGINSDNEDYQRFKIIQRGWKINKGSALSDKEHDILIAKVNAILNATIDAAKQNIKGL